MPFRRDVTSAGRTAITHYPRFGTGRFQPRPILGGIGGQETIQQVNETESSFQTGSRSRRKRDRKTEAEFSPSSADELFHEYVSKS